MPDALSDAKAALAAANKSFPSPGEPSSIKAAGAASPAPIAAPVKHAPNLGDELAAKKVMVDKARSALPKMHKGGEVPADGGYQLKAGEHVLAASETVKARQHALMASGVASLAKPAVAKTKKK